jgi:hypothetical protein
VLRLPESHPPADPAYDAAILAAHDAASARTSQPVRLLVELNPWLTRWQVRDQVRAARRRLPERATIDVTTILMPPPDSDTAVPPAVQLPLLSLDDAERVVRVREAHRLTGRWMTASQLVMYGLVPDLGTAERVVAAARKAHAST